MLKKSNPFTKAFISDMGEQIFISVPSLILQISITLFFQTLLFSIYEAPKKGVEPLFLSLALSIVYFSAFLFIRKRRVARILPQFSFILLLVFFLSEFYFFIIFNIKYTWTFLLLIQILCGYYLLSKTCFYSITAVLSVLYICYIWNLFSTELDMGSVLIILLAYMLSFLIHGDRRKALLNLYDINNSQREINNRFEQLEENIGQIFILCSSDFTEYYYISSAFERMFTISRAELIDNPHMWFEFIHPGDKERVLLELKNAYSDKLFHEIDFRVRRNDNHIWLQFQLMPIDSKKANSIDRIVVIIENITDKKNAELKLAEAKSLDSEFAARIQKNLLFSDPALGIKDLDIAAESIPSMAVGGDFFDFYCFSDRIVDFIIADVMGKGMIASMLGAAAKSAFLKSRLDLTVLENDIPSIENIMTMTNQTLSPELIHLGKFITMQYARLNLQNTIFTFIDSGHTSILYYSSKHKCSWSLKGWNMPIGFNLQEKMISNIIPFESNDLFFFYSDGVTETVNKEGEQFGERRLNYVLNNSVHLTSSQIIQKVRNLVFHYSSAEGFADDVTCIAMKIGEVEENTILVDSIFSGNRKSLKVIRSFSSEFLETNFPHVGEEQKNAVILAVNEAAANIVEHNYEINPELEGREIFIEAGKKDNICFFCLYYDGEDFDWSSVTAPDLKELKDGGYGVQIMKEIMDSVCYSTNIDGVQCLRLVKYL